MEDRRVRQRWTTLILCMTALGLTHLLLVAWFEPLRILLGAEPVTQRDFYTHAVQALRVSEALDGWGRGWAYDVQLLAGYPTGTVFDTDNKAWELWTFGLWKLGLDWTLAFNLFVLAAHLAMPIVVVGAARLMRMNWRATLIAAGLGMGLWFFDSLVHTLHWVGMMAFAIVGYLFLLPVALLMRFVSGGRWWHAALMAMCLAAGPLVHPCIFLALVPPMLAIYARAFRGLEKWRHAALWASALVVVIANLWWVVPALRFSG